MTTPLKLQRVALAAYENDEYNAARLTNQNVERIIVGDGLALFIWREVSDAEGDPDQAVRLLREAKRQLDDVINALERERDDFKE